VVRVLKHMARIRALPSCFFKIIFIASYEALVGSPSGFFPSGFPTKTLYAFFLLSHTSHKPRPSHPPLLKKGKGFPLQAWNRSWGFRRLRLLDRLDFRHYEGGKVVTLTHRPPLPPVHMVPSVASEKIPSDSTGNRFRDLPTSRAVPLPLRHPRPLLLSFMTRIIFCVLYRS
jgi:hypothetical protein